MQEPVVSLTRTLSTQMSINDRQQVMFNTITKSMRKETYIPEF